MKLRIGTRGSKLALTQTSMVIAALKSVDQGIETETVIIKTKGDLILDKSLDKIGDKGLFVAEIEEQLRLGYIDMAIHSMKDLPSEDSCEFLIFPVLKREDPRDVLVTKHSISSIYELPDHAIIGTGSKRRKIQIETLLPTATVVPIRGNVETRIEKMIQQDMDGTILAAAGINRLAIKSTDSFTIIPFNINQMVPAPGQGILACQIMQNNKSIETIVKALIDPSTYLEAVTERAFLKAVGGGCHMPLGAYLENQSDSIKFHYLFGDENCEKIIKDTVDIKNNIDCKVLEKKLINKAIELAQYAVAEVEG